MFTLLTLERVFQGMSSKEAKKRVKAGKKPKPARNMEVWISKDPIDVALKVAMDMCLKTDIPERATARQVETWLKGRLEAIDPAPKVHPVFAVP